MSITPAGNRGEQVVADARRNREEREQGYRDKALKMYPWVCGRCQREFNHKNLRELTVHHRNHDHDFNPENGSNWELLCLFCHDNEHSRYTEARGEGSSQSSSSSSESTHNPFANLGSLLKESGKQK